MYREMCRLLRAAQQAAPPPRGVWVLTHQGAGYYRLQIHDGTAAHDLPVPVWGSVRRMVRLLADLVEGG